MKHKIFYLIFLVSLLNFSQEKLIDSLAKEFLRDTTHYGIAFGVQKGNSISTSYYGGKYSQIDENISKRTLFEIGSVTKIYTTYILSALEIEGKLKSESLLINYLPNNFKNKKVLSSITLTNLATHTSGIPITAWDDWNELQKEENFNEDNPFDLLTKEFLYTKLEKVESLNEYGVPRYSNFGFGLLTVILEEVTGLKYADLLEKYVTKPLQLGSTFTEVPETRIHDVAMAHKNGVQVPFIQLSDSKGTGAIKTSIDELLNFLTLLTMPSEDNKVKAIQEHALRTPFNNERLKAVGSGWGIFYLENEKIFWKNGGTYGSGSIVIICPNKEISLAILCNSDSTDLIQGYAIKLMKKLLII
ncbi:MAG: hypothetical protein Wins2KO_13020 [Winogradskyella sp.]